MKKRSTKKKRDGRHAVAAGMPVRVSLWRQSTAGARVPCALARRGGCPLFKINTSRPIGRGFHCRECRANISGAPAETAAPLYRTHHKYHKTDDAFQCDLPAVIPDHYEYDSIECSGLAGTVTVKNVRVHRKTGIPGFNATTTDRSCTFPTVIVHPDLFTVTPPVQRFFLCTF